MRFRFALALSLVLAGCAATAPLPDLSGVDVLLVGEQHDASDHPRLHARWVTHIAQGGALRALVLEMAERGTSTAGLPASASEAQVQQALRWDTQGWPWERYGPAIMSAVRAGVPVLGANLPRGQLRQAMQDASLDRLLAGPALKAQQQAVRLGHCELLPEQQITPMTRVQIARDQAMAQTIASVLAARQTVLLLAGSGHVKPDLGVPLHLPSTVSVRTIVLPAQDTGKDYCAEFRRQQGPGARGAS
jgi:uncharacterized iron-regulated protein